MGTIELTVSAATLPILVVAAAIFLLGVAVLVRERGSGVSLSFLVLTFSVWLWLTSVGLMTMAMNADVAFAFARAAYVGVALIPAALLQFTLTLLVGTQRRRALLLASWASAAFFIVLFTTSPALLDGTWRYAWGFYPRLTAASATFLVYFFALLAMSLLLLARKRPHSDSERLRNASFLRAFAVGYFASIDFIPAFGIDIYPAGCIAILGFAILAGRAIVRFRLADLTATFVADQLLETIHGGVIVVDPRGRVRVANGGAAELLGWPREDLLGADLRTILEVPTLPVTDTDSFCRRSVSRNRLMQWRRRDGSHVELSVSASALRDAQGDTVGVLYALSDVSDRRRAERNEYGATHDLLTSLPNRVRFAEMFDAQKERIVESGRVPAILFIDLDGFKSINDVHGHDVGDRLLQLVAMRARNAIRGDDVLARYGGDEFVLFFDLARADDATLVGGKLLRVIGAPYTIDDHRVTVSASIGAAFYPRDGKTVEALVRVADTAMYAAKRAGKARIQIHAPREDRPAPSPFGMDANA